MVLFLLNYGTYLLHWTDVPSTIDIKGGKTISISVKDALTNHHFAGHPVFGVVTSFTLCGFIIICSVNIDCGITSSI